MKRTPANLTAAVLCTLVLGTPLMHRAWALSCNGKTPTLGNCGLENKCEGRDAASCTTSFGHYHKDTGGIACQSGPPNAYCAQSTAAGSDMKCTCEWKCIPNPATGACQQGPTHNIGTLQVCSTMQQYLSRSCTIGGH